MMGATLIESVLAGGVVFPAGTVREGEAAEAIPAGAWWSDGGESTSDDEPDDDGLFDPSKHNQDEVIAHLEAADEGERARVLAAEATREKGPRQRVAAWSDGGESTSDDES